MKKFPKLLFNFLFLTSLGLSAALSSHLVKTDVEPISKTDSLNAKSFLMKGKKLAPQINFQQQAFKTLFKTSLNDSGVYPIAYQIGSDDRLHIYYPNEDGIIDLFADTQTTSSIFLTTFSTYNNKSSKGIFSSSTPSIFSNANFSYNFFGNFLFDFYSQTSRRDLLTANEHVLVDYPLSFLTNPNNLEPITELLKMIRDPLNSGWSGSIFQKVISQAAANQPQYETSLEAPDFLNGRLRQTQLPGTSVLELYPQYIPEENYNIIDNGPFSLMPETVTVNFVDPHLRGFINDNQAVGLTDNFNLTLNVYLRAKPLEISLTQSECDYKYLNLAKVCELPISRPRFAYASVPDVTSVGNFYWAAPESMQSIIRNNDNIGNSWLSMECSHQELSGRILDAHTDININYSEPQAGDTLNGLIMGWYNDINNNLVSYGNTPVAFKTWQGEPI